MPDQPKSLYDLIIERTGTDSLGIAPVGDTPGDDQLRRLGGELGYDEIMSSRGVDSTVYNPAYGAQNPKFEEPQSGLSLGSFFNNVVAGAGRLPGDIAHFVAEVPVMLGHPANMGAVPFQMNQETGQYEAVTNADGSIDWSATGYDPAKVRVDDLHHWADAYGQWLHENLDTGDPQRFMNQLGNGIGSMLGFMGVSVATGGAASWMGASAQTVRALGLTTSVFLEASAEAGGIYADLKRQGMPDDDVSAQMQELFAVNVPMLMVTNAPYFSQLRWFNVGWANALARGGLEAAGESVQETYQTIMGNTATGRPWHEGVKDAALIGGLIGAGASYFGDLTEYMSPDNEDQLRIIADEIGKAVRGEESGANVSAEDISDYQKIVGLSREFSRKHKFEVETLAAGRAALAMLRDQTLKEGRVVADPARVANILENIELAQGETELTERFPDIFERVIEHRTSVDNEIGDETVERLKHLMPNIDFSELPAGEVDFLLRATMVADQMHDGGSGDTARELELRIKKRTIELWRTAMEREQYGEWLGDMAQSVGIPEHELSLMAAVSNEVKMFLDRWPKLGDNGREFVTAELQSRYKTMNWQTIMQPQIDSFMMQLVPRLEGTAPPLPFEEGGPAPPGPMRPITEDTATIVDDIMEQVRRVNLGDVEEGGAEPQAGGAPAVTEEGGGAPSVTGDTLGDAMSADTVSPEQAAALGDEEIVQAMRIVPWRSRSRIMLHAEWLKRRGELEETVEELAEGNEREREEAAGLALAAAEMGELSLAEAIARRLEEKDAARGEHGDLERMADGSTEGRAVRQSGESALRGLAAGINTQLPETWTGDQFLLGTESAIREGTLPDLYDAAPDRSTQVRMAEAITELGYSLEEAHEASRTRLLGQADRPASAADWRPHVERFIADYSEEELADAIEVRGGDLSRDELKERMSVAVAGAMSGVSPGWVRGLNDTELQDVHQWLEGIVEQSGLSPYAFDGLWQFRAEVSRRSETYDTKLQRYTPFVIISLERASQQLEAAGEDPGGLTNRMNVTAWPGHGNEPSVSVGLSLRDFLAGRLRPAQERGRKKGKIGVVAQTWGEQYQAQGAAALMGHVYRDINELAELAQALRHPGMEVLRLILVRDLPDGTVEIVGKPTSFAIGAQWMAAASSDQVREMADTMNRVGATGFIHIHNHPRDKEIEPSGGDIQASAAMAKHFGDRYRGAMIIDHGKYAWMSPDGSVQNGEVATDFVNDPYLRGGDAWLEQVEVENLDDLAELALTLNYNPGMVTVIGVQANQSVQGVYSLPAELFNDGLAPSGRLHIGETMRRLRRWSNASGLFVMLTPEQDQRVDPGVLTSLLTGQYLGITGDVLYYGTDRDGMGTSEGIGQYLPFDAKMQMEMNPKLDGRIINTIMPMVWRLRHYPIGSNPNDKRSLWVGTLAEEIRRSSEAVDTDRTGSEWKDILGSRDEVRWLGLDQWLDERADQQVPTVEIIEYVRGHDVNFRVRSLVSNETPQQLQDAAQAADKASEATDDEVERSYQRRLAAGIREDIEPGGDPGTYRLPGSVDSFELVFSDGARARCDVRIYQDGGVLRKVIMVNEIDGDQQDVIMRHLARFAAGEGADSIAVRQDISQEAVTALAGLGESWGTGVVLTDIPVSVSGEISALVSGIHGDAISAARTGNDDAVGELADITPHKLIKLGELLRHENVAEFQSLVITPEMRERYSRGIAAFREPRRIRPGSAQRGARKLLAQSGKFTSPGVSRTPPAGERARAALRKVWDIVRMRGAPWFPTNRTDDSPEMERQVKRSKAARKGKVEWSRYTPSAMYWRLYGAWVDDLNPIFRAQMAQLNRLGKIVGRKVKLSDVPISERPYELFRMARAAAAKANAFIQGGVRKWDDPGAIMTASLQDIVNMIPPANLEPFQQYLIALREIELQKTHPEVDTPFAMELADAEKIVEQYGDAPNFKQAARELHHYFDTMIQYGVDSGALSQEQFDTMTQMYRNYVPFWAIAFIDQNGRVVQNKPSAKIGSIVGRLGAATGPNVVMPPLEAAIRNTYMLVQKFEMNHAMMKLVDWGLAEQIDNPSEVGLDMTAQEAIDTLIEKEGMTDTERGMLTSLARIGIFSQQGVVSVLRDGVETFYRVDPDVWQAVMQTERSSMEVLEKVLTAPTRLLRAGAIFSPEFMARNPMRDIIFASVTSPHIMVWHFNDIMKALVHVTQQGPQWEKWMVSGAPMSNMVAVDRNASEKKLADLIKRGMTLGRVRNATFKLMNNPGDVLLKLPGNSVEALRAVSSTSEDTTRVAVFTRSLERYLAKVGSEQFATVRDAYLQAAMDSRDATLDFLRAGRLGYRVNRWVPFFNPAIQGHDKVARAFLGRGETRGRTARTWGKALMLITLPSVIEYMMYHDDEWYQELPRWLKMHYWIFSPDNGLTVQVYPKPHEVGFIFGSMVTSYLHWLKGEDPRALEKWGEMFIKQVQPFQFPTAVEVIVEQWANRSFFTGRPLVGKRLGKVDPEYQFSEGTPEIAVALGNELGASPARIYSLVRSSFGGVGYHVMKAASPGVDREKYGLAAVRPEKHKWLGLMPMDWPVIRAFIRAAPEKYTRSMEDFFEFYDKAQKAHNTYRHLMGGDGRMPAGSAEQIERYAIKNALWVFSYSALNQQNEALMRMYANVRAMEGAALDHEIDGMVMSGMTKEAAEKELAQRKREVIDDLYRQMNLVAKAGVLIIREAEKQLPEVMAGMKEVLAEEGEVPW